MEPMNQLSEEKINLELCISRVEALVEATEGKELLSKDLGAFFEDLSERLNDISTRIAHSHRRQDPIIEQALKHANRR